MSPGAGDRGGCGFYLAARTVGNAPAVTLTWGGATGLRVAKSMKAYQKTLVGMPSMNH